MRRPSSLKALYSWHRALIAGECPARHDSDPQCGWYKTRLVKGGPWIPVEIRCERDIDPETGELTSDERLIAYVEGKPRDPHPMWSFLVGISRQEFDTLEDYHNTNPDMRATLARMDLTERAARP